MRSDCPACRPGRAESPSGEPTAARGPCPRCGAAPSGRAPVRTRGSEESREEPATIEMSVEELEGGPPPEGEDVDETLRECVDPELIARPSPPAAALGDASQVSAPSGPNPERRSLYERVADGAYSPPPKRGVSHLAAAPRRRAWNEPSETAVKAHGAVGGLALALERAPWWGKVMLLISPLILGGTLLWSAGAKPDDESGTSREASTPLAPSMEGRAGPSETGPQGPETRSGTPTIGANISTAFLQRSARVRTHPDERATPRARIVAGSEVRVLERVGDWSLVFFAPGGPAGFVRATDLGPHRSTEAVADALAFEGCRSHRRRPRDVCLSASDAQRRRCVSRCEVSPRTDAPVERCIAACGVAHKRCNVACDRR